MISAADDCAGLDQIEVWDTAGGARATWESDDYRVRRAAPELLEALKDLHDQLECLGKDTSKKIPSVTKSKSAIAEAEHRRA